jgi:predicted RNA-binding protein with PUA-like domain
MRSRNIELNVQFELQSGIMNWLFKEEPANYSFDALTKDKKTVWSGVRNPLAQKHLRAIRKGDAVFFYHTGDEKSVVGVARALGNAYPDPADKTGKASVVDIAPVKKLARPVTLAEIKADPAFKDFALVRISRLSVMPVSDAEWRRIEKLATSTP